MNFDALRHYARARLFQFLKQPARAIAEYRLALKFNPDFTAAASAAAFLLAADKRFTEAESLLRDSLRLQADNADTWYNLGFVCAELHKPAEAVTAFREAVNRNRRLDLAWYGLGLALATQHQHAQAAQAFEQAAQLKPMNGHIWYQLGMAYHWLHAADKVKGIVEHLDRFDRHMARRLILDSGRSDLAHVVADLRARR
jgi:tetratricopeptide (TPR) repeat protein